jgi:uncharacterized protein YjbI with pentapeptide repeats
MVALSLVLVLIAAVLSGIWLWGELVDYINPKDATGRKDAVQVFALIVAGIVGIVGAGVGLANVYFSRKNLEHNQDTLNQQRLLEAQRAQDVAQQAYFEQMGNLLTEHGLRKSEVNDDARLLAEAQTATVLQTLDTARKAQIIQFLSRAQLIDRDDNIVVLVWADLSYVDLSNWSLLETDFEGAKLSHAVLRDTDLSRSNLTGTDLVGADLRTADLSYSYLNYADLTNAKLAGANLSNSNLLNAKGIADAELRKCRSLEGATMPNGQKYDDWLKSKGRGEHGENSSLS